MLLKPATVLALRHNGTALRLTVESLDNLNCNLTAQGRGTFHLTSSKLGPDPIRTLHAAFAHYPNPVTINDEPVDRTPFPNHASVRMAYAPDMDRSNTRIIPHMLDERTRNQGDLNTYAGGLLSDITRVHRAPQVYWAKLPSQHEHWSQAATVFVTPVYVVTDEELDSLDTDHFNNHRDTINDRADAQVEETMKHPNMPHFYMDEPFHHIIGAPVYSNEAKTMGAPIYVHGMPATFSAMTPSPALVSAAQALYRTNTGIVPVVTAQRPKQDKASHKKIENFRFDVTPGENQPPEEGAITPVKHINMKLKLEGENTPRTLPAPFVMHGQDANELRVEFVPHLTDPQDLEKSIIQAYGDPSEYMTTEEDQEYMEELTRRVKNLIEQLPPVFG